MTIVTKTQIRSADRVITKMEVQNKAIPLFVNQHSSYDFVCHICDKKFPKKYNRDRHLKTHSSVEHKCPECHQNFNSSKGFSLHLSFHEKEEEADKTFKCDREFCTATFKLEINLKRHFKFHDNLVRRPFVCLKCNVTFNDKSELETHLKTYCTCRKVFKFTFCSKTFPRKYNLIRHENSIQKCNGIKNKKLSKTNLKNHVSSDPLQQPPRNSDETIASDISAVSQVSNTFTNPFISNNHIQHKMPDVKPFFNCATCNRTFTRKYHLQNHLKSSIHHGVKNQKHQFTCPQCQKPFSQKQYLQQHLLIHQKRNEAPTFSCKPCNKTFCSKRNLKLHLEISLSHIVDNQNQTKQQKMSDVKPFFNCAPCNRTFTRKHHLQIHLKSFAHNKVKNQYEQFIFCPQCQMPFSQKHYLKRHLFIHQKRTNISKVPTKTTFSCKPCNKTFCSKRNLKLHLETTLPHISEGKGSKIKSSSSAKSTTYICKPCNKIFSEIRHLKMHLKMSLSHISEGESSSSTQCPVIQDILNTNEADKAVIKSTTKSFPCVVCKTVYYRKETLMRHFKSDMHIENENKLKIHENNSNMSEKNVQVKIETDNQIDDQLIIKPFPCFQCEMCFDSEKVLMCHLEVHLQK